MKSLLKYLGAIILLIGVLVIAIPYFIQSTSNMTLGIGLGLVIIGFIVHIFGNKKVGED